MSVELDFGHRSLQTTTERVCDVQVMKKDGKTEKKNSLINALFLEDELQRGPTKDDAREGHNDHDGQRQQHSASFLWPAHD